MANQNLKIHRFIDTRKGININYTIINRVEENTNGTAAILMGINRLENKEIDFVYINKVLFTRESFQFKSSNNFNHSLAVRVFIDQYYIDDINDFLAFCNKEGI